MNRTPSGFLTPNQVLRGHYRILYKIADGGFGAVYKAEDTHPNLGKRPVAIKEMIQNSLMSPQEIQERTELFKQEALLLARLHHQNLPHIYDYFDEAGYWYLVMDFIEGGTLEDYLQRQGGRFKVEEALDIGIQLCAVLDYLHTHQPPIIFRDLKPLNIMRAPGGHLYLIDFGIARFFKPGKAKDTALYGSPGYAAPEQGGKAQTDGRSDIYSLGATLHQLIAGEDPSYHPFQFEAFSFYAQQVPSELEALIFQMLEMRMDKRPPSASFVKKELQRIQTLLSMPPQAPIKPPQPPRPIPPAPPRQHQIQIHQPPPKVQAPPIKPVALLGETEQKVLAVLFGVFAGSLVFPLVSPFLSIGFHNPVVWFICFLVIQSILLAFAGFLTTMIAPLKVGVITGYTGLSAGIIIGIFNAFFFFSLSNAITNIGFFATYAMIPAAIGAWLAKLGQNHLSLTLWKPNRWVIAFLLAGAISAVILSFVSVRVMMSSYPSVNP